MSKLENLTKRAQLALGTDCKVRESTADNKIIYSVDIRVSGIPYGCDTSGGNDFDMGLRCIQQMIDYDKERANCHQN